MSESLVMEKLPWISVLYFVIILTLIINLIMTGQRPTKTLAWLMVLVFLPVLGALLYFTFGVNRRQFGFIDFKKKRRTKRYLARADQYLDGLLKSEEHQLQNTRGMERCVEQINVNSGAFRASISPSNAAPGGGSSSVVAWACCPEPAGAVLRAGAR